LYELIINYTGGSIKYNSVEEIQQSGVVTNNDIYLGTGITSVQQDDAPNTNDENVHFDDLFNQIAVNTHQNERVWLNSHGEKMYFYIKLNTPINDVTGFDYWTSKYSGIKFNDLSIYGTDIDPSTMSDIHDTSNWDLLTTASNTTSYTTDDAVP